MRLKMEYESCERSLAGEVGKSTNTGVMNKDSTNGGTSRRTAGGSSTAEWMGMKITGRRRRRGVTELVDPDDAA